MLQNLCLDNTDPGRTPMCTEPPPAASSKRTWTWKTRFEVLIKRQPLVGAAAICVSISCIALSDSMLVNELLKFENRIMIPDIYLSTSTRRRTKERSTGTMMPLSQAITTTLLCAPHSPVPELSPEPQRPVDFTMASREPMFPWFALASDGRARQ